MALDIIRMKQLAGIAVSLQESKEAEEKRLAQLNEGLFNDDDDDDDDEVKKYEKDLKKIGVKASGAKADVESDIAKQHRMNQKVKKEGKKDLLDDDREDDEARENREDADEAEIKKRDAKDKDTKDKDNEEVDREAKAYNPWLQLMAPEKKPVPPKVKKEPVPDNGEPKKRGKPINADSKSQRAANYIKSNPGLKRGEFLKWAAAELDMGSNYASAFFARLSPKSGRAVKTDECFILAHPMLKNHLLSENTMLHQYQWIDESSPMEPMVFDTLDEAMKTAEFMQEWRNQHVDIIKVSLL
jgi:hypothetical protein